MNYYREIGEQNISPEDGVQIGKDFLSQKGYQNMKETYYMVQSGNVVINYAYSQDDVVVYSDLIKVKIALDNRRSAWNGVGWIPKLPYRKGYF